MYLGQEHRITDWFILHFTENNGMAFGMEFGGEYGKLALSIFRIIFVAGIFIYLKRIVKAQSDPFYITCIAMIIAGAAGNIIDSTFYGMIFSGSEYQVATLFPTGGGYSDFLHGKVVDMLYFPVAEGIFPKWLPVWGGEEYQFFRPVFNIADASISIGVFLLFIFQKRFFNSHTELQQETTTPTTTPSADGIQQG